MYNFAKGVEYDIEMENGKRYSHCTVDVGYGRSIADTVKDGYITISMKREKDNMIIQYDLCYDKIMVINESRKFFYYWVERNENDGHIYKDGYIYKELHVNDFSPRELKANGLTVYSEKDEAIHYMLEEIAADPQLNKIILNDRTNTSACICRLANDGTWVGTHGVHLVELVNELYKNNANKNV